jgi:hypothetical protein
VPKSSGPQSFKKTPIHRLFRRYDPSKSPTRFPEDPSFLNGVDWDSEGYVKLQAISITGEHLRKNNDIEILKTVYSIFSNETERPLMRNAAYFALCRSEGVEWRDMPPASRILDFSREADQVIVASVQRKLDLQ